MKILIYGESWENTMANLLSSAMDKLGHTPVIFDHTQFLYRSRGITLKNRILDRLLVRAVSQRINAYFLKIVENEGPEVIIVSKGIHLFPETVEMVKKKVRYIVNWNPDDFFNSINSSPYLLSSFNKYDVIFTPRTHLAGEYYKRGAKRVEILNWYYDPKIHYPIHVPADEMAEWESSISFIGTWSKHRETVLASLEGLDVKIWGGYWHRASYGFRKKFNIMYRWLNSQEMSKAINSSRINLNIQTKENRDQTNLKNFEILACRGFILTDRTPEILKLFKENEEIACYVSATELRQQCKLFLSNESFRQEIAEYGHKAVTLRKHTMLDRARQLLRAISI